MNAAYSGCSYPQNLIRLKDFPSDAGAQKHCMAHAPYAPPLSGRRLGPSRGPGRLRPGVDAQTGRLRVDPTCMERSRGRSLGAPRQHRRGKSSPPQPLHRCTPLQMAPSRRWYQHVCHHDMATAVRNIEIANNRLKYCMPKFEQLPKPGSKLGAGVRLLHFPPGVGECHDMHAARWCWKPCICCMQGSGALVGMHVHISALPPGDCFMPRHATPIIAEDDTLLS